ncbi:MAG TPA: hypothetical protein VNK04_24420 [Gemmataceae bacterium]|nr:hypothetical protein [Gemmataceae bacterium]
MATRTLMAFVRWLTTRTLTTLALIGIAAGCERIPETPPSQASTEQIKSIPVGSVSAIALSPDGKLLAAGSTNSVSLWGVAEGLLAQINWDSGSTEACGYLAFSPDGKRLVSVHEGYTYDLPRLAVRIWEITPDNNLREMRRPPLREREGWDRASIVHHASFSPDGNILIFGRTDGTICMWDLASESIRTYNRGGVAAAFSPEGRTLFIVSHNGRVHRLEAATGKLIATNKETQSGSYMYVDRVAFAPNGKLVALSDGASVQLRDIETDVMANRFIVQGVSTLCFSSDSKWLVAGIYRRGILFIDVVTGKKSFWFGSGAIYKGPFAFSRDGQYVAWADEKSVLIGKTEGILAAKYGASKLLNGNRTDATLEAELVVIKDTYRLPSGVNPVEELSFQLGRTASPLPPQVDLALKVRNVGNEQIQVRRDDLTLYLVGSGAFNVPIPPTQTGVSFLSREPPSLTLSPGESYTRRVTNLESNIFKSYWLLPGEYLIGGMYSVEVLPRPTGAMGADGGSGYIEVEVAPKNVQVLPGQE